MALSENILQAISQSHRLMLEQPNIESSISNILRVLGEATVVDRVYVFQKKYAIRPYYTYTHEWCAPGIEPQIDYEPLKKAYLDEFSDVLGALEMNELIHDFVENSSSPAFKEAMEYQGIISYLFLPIFCNELLWGFMGFDNCTQKALFSNSQLAGLQSVASSMGLLTSKAEKEQELHRNRKLLQSILDNTQEVILRINKEGKILYVNKRWEILTQYSVLETTHQNILSFTHNFDLSLLQYYKPRKNFISLQLITKNGKHIDTGFLFEKHSSKKEDEVLYQGMIVADPLHLSQIKEIQQLEKLNENLSSLHHAILNQKSFSSNLDELLTSLLDFTESQFGFLGEVLYDQDENPYLKTHSITDISWNEETSAFYKRYKEQGMEFRNLDTLFGRVLTSKQLLISNQPASDHRGAGIPKGHPPLEAFIGIPIVHEDELLGMIGLANRKEGYNEDMAIKLKSITKGYAGLIKSIRNNRNMEQQSRDAALLRQIYEKVVTHSNDIIAIHNLDMTFQYVSPSIHTILGYAPEELIGKSPDEAMLPLNKEILEENAQYQRLLITHHTKNQNKKVTLEIIFKPITDPEGKIEFYLATGRDVSLQQNLVNNLNKSFLEQKRLIQAKSNFISITSHELRTPISTLSTSIDILNFMVTKNQGTEIPALKLAPHLLKMKHQARKIIEIINNVHNIEKIENQNFNLLEEVDVADLLTMVMQNFPNTLIHIKKQNRTIRGNKFFLETILTNLLENAHKYSHKDSKVPELKIEFTAKEVVFKVKDDGIGIPNEEKDRVFNLFFRGSNTQGIYGTGIGLGIVKKISDTLGGTIEVRSKQNAGTEFIVTLPII